MRVSLAPTARPGIAGPAAPLLDRRGARAILGAIPSGPAPVRPLAPSPRSLFGPRGAALAGRAGPLLVCDSGHHRLLVWRKTPSGDDAPADYAIGQPDLVSEGRNAQERVARASLNVPTGVAIGGEILAVADAWNHRVLLWHGLPSRANAPPDIVLGQADFVSDLANRGASEPRADTLHWCYGVAIDAGRLFVADTGNRRVLVWDRIPERPGAPADRVLGQDDFTTRDDGAGRPAGASGMRWPHAIAIGAGRIFVADAGNNRVMVWNGMPGTNGAPCDFVLGQADRSALDHNRARYLPTAATLNMPYGLTLAGDRLVVADTANSRLLGFALQGLAMGAPAQSLAGQNDFDGKGDNHWAAPARDSLCWPYAVAACGETLIIADSGNNRVLLWGLA